jgi:hypothetical protein
MRPSLATTLLLLASAACNRTEKACERARDLMVEVWQESSKQALATAPHDQRAKLREQSATEIEQARTRFVERCVALPELGRVCIGRMDIMVAAHREVQAAKAACKLDEFGMPDPACIEAAQAKSKQAMMGCDSSMDAFYAELFAP